MLTTSRSFLFALPLARYYGIVHVIRLLNYSVENSKRSLLELVLPELCNAPELPSVVLKCSGYFCIFSCVF